MVCSLFRKRDGTYRGTKICCFEVKVPHGACPHFGLQAFMKAMDILAGDHRQRFLVSDHSVLTCIIYIRVPVSLALSSCHYVLRPRPGLGQASVSLGAPRMPTNLLHHGP